MQFAQFDCMKLYKTHLHGNDFKLSADVSFQTELIFCSYYYFNGTFAWKIFRKTARRCSKKYYFFILLQCLIKLHKKIMFELYPDKFWQLNLSLGLRKIYKTTGAYLLHRDEEKTWLSVSLLLITFWS